MRRLTARRSTAAVAAAAAAFLSVPMIGVPASPAAAQSEAPQTPEASQTEGPPVGEAVAGEEVCTIGDPRLVELSGLVAVEEGYLVVNDGTEFVDRQGVFVLDQGCQVVDQIAYPTPPLDPEDLELDRESNTLWVGDTGDNVAAGLAEGDARPSVAFWRIELDGDRVPVIHRFTYPDGEPHDAETLLMSGDGTPIIVTREIGGAELFLPQELRPSSSPEDAVPLEKVGEFTTVETGTEHVLGAIAGQVVTGGNTAPDGSAVVLRTYTDAYEFEVTDGNVAAAITDGEPVITPLPDEPLAEAISYTPDGERFVTVSEVPEDVEYTPTILSYEPASPPPPPEQAEQAAGESGGGGGGSLFDSVQDIVNVIAAVGVLGLLLVAAGVFGIVRARRRSPDTGPDGEAGADQPAPDAPVTGRARLSGAPGSEPRPGWDSDQAGQPTGVYTSQAVRQPGTEYGAAPGPEYGGQPGAEYGGTEYGGTQYGGTQYGGRAGAEYGGGGHPGREYGAAGYGGAQHAGAEYGYGGSGYAGTEYGAAGYPPGTEYGGAGYSGAPGYDQPGGGAYRSGGYRDQPYDQEHEWSNGHHAPPQPGHAYADPGYPDHGYPAAPGDGTAAGPGGAYTGGTYQSGAHAGQRDGYRDDYSDDPDYPYEFRQPGRW